MEKKEAPRATPGKREPSGIAVQRARIGDCGETADDFISMLPDAVLCTIISLLGTKDGGRTQALSRLWRSAPLNLEVLTRPPADPISRHHGPARLFYFHCLRDDEVYAQAESWFLSGPSPTSRSSMPATATSRCCRRRSARRPPSSSPRSATAISPVTVRLFPASPSSSSSPYCMFPSQRTASTHCSLAAMPWRAYAYPKFVLPVASVLARRLSIGFRDNHSEETELVIEDAPRLVRLLLPYCYQDDCVTIRIIWAPKLEIMGPFAAFVSKLLLFQRKSPVSSANSMHTVKVLALRSSGDKLHAVLNILRWFPCLEKLYVTFHKRYEMAAKNEPQYDPRHPIECLQTHLKNVVFMLYWGNGNRNRLTLPDSLF